MAHRSEQSTFLRRSLQANGAFSLATGLAMVIACKPLSNLIGMSHPWVLAGIGVSLVAFAAGLFVNSRRVSVDEREAMTAIILDFGWVVGSVVLISIGVLNATGNWTVALVADLVFVFAILQTVGLRRVRRAAGACE